MTRVRPQKHVVRLHGALAEKYHSGDIEVYADSITMLFRILFKSIFPTFMDNERHFTIVFEDHDGNFTEVFDAEQVLPKGSLKVHILPNPDGAELITLLYVVIVAIIAIGVALLLAPKMEYSQDTASGANWQTPDNVIGQGGATPVLLGTRLVGSRVVSHGIDSTVFAEYRPSIYRP